MISSPEFWEENGIYTELRRKTNKQTEKLPRGILLLRWGPELRPLNSCNKVCLVKKNNIVQWPVGLMLSVGGKR